MISFQKLDRLNGHEIKENIQLADIQAAEKIVSDLFNKIHAWAFAKTEYGNGIISLAIKDSGNKIIYQLKTII